MPNAPARGEPTLPALLAARARGASDRRLALDGVVGIIGAVLGAALRPPGWVALLSAALCLAAYGSWGILDRELGERADAVGVVPRALRVGRTAAVALGALAALVLALTLFALALGTWIS